MATDWHYEDIKAILRKSGYTMTRLSKEMGLKTPQSVLNVKKHSCPKVERKVASILGVPVWVIWPERWVRKDEGAVLRKHLWPKEDVEDQQKRSA